MIKFAQKCLFLISLLFLSPVQAGYISADLTEDNYIVIGDLQWAWASPVNVEIWGNNTLYVPELHDGWGYASNEQLNLLKQAIRADLADNVFDLFTRDNGSGTFYVNAFGYWNSLYTNVNEIDDVTSEILRSVWAENDALAPAKGTLAYFLMVQADTFYVRPNNIQGGGSGGVNVPEPTTLMIFSIGLIALALRKKSLL